MSDLIRIWVYRLSTWYIQICWEKFSAKLNLDSVYLSSLQRLKRLYSPGNFSSLSEWFLFGAIRRSPWHPFPADFRNIHDPGRELWARGCFCRVSHSRGLPTVSWSPFSVWKKYWKKDFCRNIDKSSSYIANFSSVTKIGLLYYKRITFCYKI